MKQKANAKLIAAAPELLESLKCVVAKFRGVYECCEKTLNDVGLSLPKAFEEWEPMKKAIELIKRIEGE